MSCRCSIGSSCGGVVLRHGGHSLSKSCKGCGQCSVGSGSAGFGHGGVWIGCVGVEVLTSESTK